MNHVVDVQLDRAAERLAEVTHLERQGDALPEIRQDQRSVQPPCVDGARSILTAVPDYVARVIADHDLLGVARHGIDRDLGARFNFVLICARRA